MKILNIIDQISIIWWIERYTEYLYDLNVNKWDFYILTYIKQISNLNIPKEKIFFLDEKIDNSFFAKVKKLFFRSKNIAKFCNKNNIDISISHGDVANLFNIISKLFWNKAKIIIILHNAFDKNLLWIPLYLLCKFTYKYADEIISVWKELAEDIKKQINTDKVKTIYNPFDFEKIEILKNEKIEDDIEKLLNNWKINICNVARLDSNKKQDLIIDCFYEYYKTNNNIQLFFIWDWDEKYRNLLIEKVKKYNLENAIFFLWFKTNVYKYIIKMHYYYYYYSGLQEWFGRWLIDALSCWVPILTHDYKYWAKEIIRNNENFTECKEIEIHENGVLTPYMDKNKYIEAMQILLETKFDKEKIIKNTKKYDIENFKKDWNLILN